jgi:L-ascorbate metabolism protein UlaG (beta-lactamase superfamily)
MPNLPLTHAGGSYDQQEHLMKITYHGHSAFRIETGKAVILIDPFFTGNPAATAGWEEASKAARICCSPTAMATIRATRWKS